MKKFLIAGLAAVAVTGAVAAPASASYGQYLSRGEACREAGSIVHNKWDGIVAGSSRGLCTVARRSASKVYVWITYRVVGQGAGWWTTKIGIHETAVDYRWRLLGDRRA